MAVGTSGEKQKADYRLDLHSLQEFVEKYYKEATNRIRQFLEEHHIALDQEKMVLVEFI